MEVVETVREGLKRELKVTVPRDDLAKRLQLRLEEIKGQVRLNGFRQGKVPIPHLRKLYGKQAMAEIVNDLINQHTGEILVERGEKAAQKPDISMTEDEMEAEAILNGKADFEFKLEYEVLPEFELPDLAELKIARPVAEISDAYVREQAEKLAESTRTYEAKSGKAASGDRITIDYTGKVDGEVFDGGADTDAHLVLGSNSFIPGFEEQLVGSKAGAKSTVEVTFPVDYRAEQLAGKKAVFDVSVKLVEKPGNVTLSDETAKQLGVESLDAMLTAIRGQVEGQNGSYTRAKVKRQVLDQLDEAVKLDLPAKMVEQEFENIWGQVTHDLEHSAKTFEDEDTTEEKAREEYHQLAERRVRLGLVLAKIGELAKIEVTDEEMQRALHHQVRQYPGQEQQVMDYFRKHPDAVAGLRAPVYEDKVIDHIVAQANVTDTPVTREELMKQDDDDE
jgi:trigger factor